MKKGFGNLVKKKPSNESLEENEPKISKEIIKEKEKFQKMDPLEKVYLVKEKLSFLQGSTTKSVEELAKRLCDTDELKKAYLNKDFKAAREYFYSTATSTEPLEKKSKMFQSVGSSTISQASFGSNEEDQDDDDLFTDFEQEDLNLVNNFKENQKIKIKLIIVEISHTKKEQNIRKFLSPIATTLGKNPQFGMFHSALVVGPWYLEWSNKALCIPKKTYSTAAILALDVQNELELSDVDFVIDGLSEVICRWNTFRDYDRGKNNCQVFIDDILDTLKINHKLTFSGALKSYLDKMRKNGIADIAYEIPKELRELAGIKQDKIKFENHKELDELVKKLLEAEEKKGVDYKTSKFKDDYQLLKSFDRAFWLRHYREKEKLEYQPLDYNVSVVQGEESVTCSCPFDDPQSTRTFAPK